MKKILATAITAVFMLISCSKDESTDSNPATIPFLTKTVQSFTGGESLTTTYTYNGDELKEIASSDGRVIKYTYNGKLVKDELFENGVLKQTREFDFYNQINTLSECHTTQHPGTQITTRRYRKNNLGEIEIISGFSVIGKIVLNGENLLTVNTNGILYSFVYDNKVNPLRKVKDNFFLTILNYDGGHNNIISLTKSNTGRISRTYDYNSYDMPQKCTEKDSDGNIISTIEYFYE